MAINRAESPATAAKPIPKSVGSEKVSAPIHQTLRHISDMTPESTAAVIAEYTTRLVVRLNAQMP